MKALNIKINSMGTISFTAQLSTSRKAKPQEFCVYPLHAGQPIDHIKIQSDDYCGYINPRTGFVELVRTQYFQQFNCHPLRIVEIENWEELKSHIRLTASAKAGLKQNGWVMTDNSQAAII